MRKTRANKDDPALSAAEANYQRLSAKTSDVLYQRRADETTTPEFIGKRIAELVADDERQTARVRKAASRIANSEIPELSKTALIPARDTDTLAQKVRRSGQTATRKC
jgi:hypothetical protein